MRELVRRVCVFLLFLLAVAAYMSVRSDFVRVHAVDMGHEYRRTYGTSPAPGVVAAGRQLVRSETALRPIADFIDFRTRDRLEVVSGEEWAELFAAARSPGTDSALAHRRSTGPSRESFFFLPEEGPFPEVFRRTRAAGDTFRYLKLTGPAGPQFLAMTVQGPGGAGEGGAPVALLRPFRPLAMWFLLAAVLLYVFPAREKAPPDALAFPAFRAWIIPDAMALVLAGLFMTLSFVLSVEIFDTGRVLDFGYGNAWFTLIFWAFALGSGAILWFTARFASFSLQLRPEGFRLRTLGSKQWIPFAAIESAEYVDFRPPKWCRGLLRLGALFNWRLLGQVLILESRADWGVALRLRDGTTTRFRCTGLPGVERFFEALRGNGVSLGEDQEETTAVEIADQPARGRRGAGWRAVTGLTGIACSLLGGLMAAHVVRVVPFGNFFLGLGLIGVGVILLWAWLRGWREVGRGVKDYLARAGGPPR